VLDDLLESLETTGPVERGSAEEKKGSSVMTRLPIQRE